MNLNIRMAPQQGRRRAVRIWLWLSVLVMAGLCGYLWWQTSLKQHDVALLETENSALEEEIKPFDLLVQQKKDTTTFRENLRDKQKAIASLCAGEQAPVSLLEELAELIPTHVFIQKFSLDRTGLTMSGEASKVVDVTNFLHVLEGSHYFIKPTLKQLGGGTGKRMQSQQTGLIPFTIVAQRK